MRKFLLSLAFLTAGLGWPVVAAAQSPGLGTPTRVPRWGARTAGTSDSGTFLASARDAQDPPPTQAKPVVQPPAPQQPPSQAKPAEPAAKPQAPPPGVNPTSVCGRDIPPPAKVPPADSSPVVYLIVPCFAKQGGTSVVEPSTYTYYIQLPPSRPSQNQWTPYDDKAQKTIEDDFKRLWATNFLDDLSIEAIDYRFSNGVMGKI